MFGGCHAYRSRVQDGFAASFPRCLRRARCPLPSHAQANDKAVDDMLNQAQTALSKGKPEEAVSILRKAIDMAPDRAELYMLRSRATGLIGQVRSRTGGCMQVHRTRTQRFHRLSESRPRLPVAREEAAGAGRRQQGHRARAERVRTATTAAPIFTTRWARKPRPRQTKPRPTSWIAKMLT